MNSPNLMRFAHTHIEYLPFPRPVEFCPLFPLHLFGTAKNKQYWVTTLVKYLWSVGEIGMYIGLLCIDYGQLNRQCRGASGLTGVSLGLP